MIEENKNVLINSVNQWNSERMAIAFAENKKAQIAARAIFQLVHQYGDNLREGWKNVLDLLLYLLRANMLPCQMIQMEDFVDPRGHVSIKERFKRIPAAPKKEESGLFSWLGFSGSSGYSESDQYKRQTEEEKELCKKATNVILECHPEQLVTDSKYLASSSLTELINNIIQCSITLAPIPPPSHATTTTIHDDGQPSHPPHDQHHRKQHESQGSSHSQDDDSLVDLTSAAALLPQTNQQEQKGTDNINQPMHSPNQSQQMSQVELAITEPHILAESTTQSSIIEPQQNMPHHEQHYAPIKLSMETEEALVFLLELMVNIVLENRDRLAQVWPLVRDHLCWLHTQFPQNHQLMDRSVVAIIRIANRNLFRLGQQLQHSHSSYSQQPRPINERTAPNKSVVIVVEDEQHQQQGADRFHTDRSLDQSIQHKTSYCADEVLQFMGRQLLSMRSPELFIFSRQISFGLQVLLRANAANIHTTEHWEMMFLLLEAVGAAAYQDDDYEMTKWPINPSRKEQFKVGVRSSYQSEPEEMVATPNQPTIDDRGYCSDDPSMMMSHQLGAAENKESGDGTGKKRRQQNPLLSAAMEPRGRVQLLNKMDSGEWIHVVSTPVTHVATGEDLHKVQEENATANEVPVSDDSTQANFTSPSEPLLPREESQQQFYQGKTHDGQHLVQNIPQLLPTAQEIADSIVQQHQIQTGAKQSHRQQDEGNVQSTSPPLQQQQQIQPPPPAPPPPHPRAGVYKRGTIVLAPNLSRHDPAAFLKVVEILTFLARDAAHITPANFSQFTHCLRMMVEASMDGGKCAPIQLPTVSIPPNISTVGHTASSKQFIVPQHNEKGKDKQQPKLEESAPMDGGGAESEKMSEQERLANCYMDASLQLLKICAQMHTRAANIYQDWFEANGQKGLAVRGHHQGTSELWTNYWRPLLQAIARMSCDCRRRIRAIALDTLGAAFRVPALGELMHPSDWENCFADVLFPLLVRLLSNSPPISPMDPIGMEEARIRAIQLVCKILLGHLTQINRLDTFPDLLRRLFDLMNQFLEGNAYSDLLAEVIQESLKNCVLVCENFGVFHGQMEGFHAEINERLKGLAKKHGHGLKMTL